MQQLSVYGLILLGCLTHVYGQTPDNIKVVNNQGIGKWGTNPVVRVELMGTLGELNTSDENFLFFLPEDMTEDHEGNIYVLDAGNYRVQKFDANLKYLSTFGGKGQGPGELTRPVAMNTDRQENIVVADRQKMSFEVFKPSGEVIRSTKIGSGAGYFRFDSKGGFVKGGTGVKRGSAISPVLSMFDQKGESPRNVGALENDGGRFIRQVINKRTFDLDPADNVYVGYRYKNRIEKYSFDGTLLYRIERTLPFDVSPPPKLDPKNMRGLETMIANPKFNDVSIAIAVDSKGRVWSATANRPMKDEERVYLYPDMSGSGGTRVEGGTEITETDMYDLEIFDSDGALLGKLPLAHFVDGMKIFGDRLYVLDKTRGMQVFIYKIVE